MTNNISILISHDSSDEKIALEIKDFIESVFLNVSAYVSGRDLIGGQTWIEQIKNRIKSSGVIISLMSNKSLNSNWVHFESGAGFTEDKTIPLLTGNLKLEYLLPPMSLLQARLINEEGVELFIKDLSKKLDLREPKNYPSIKNLVNRINKLVRTGSVLLLESLTPLSRFAPSASKQWIYDDTYLVFDYIMDDKFEISVDTVFGIDKIQILLFDRSGSKDYLTNIMSHSEIFPKSIAEYEWEDHKMIYHSYNFTTRTEIISDKLIELLSKLEIHKNRLK